MADALNEKKSAPCCIRFLCFIVVYGWCMILIALATLPIYHPGIETYDDNLNATVVDWSATTLFWACLPSSWILLSCCCCCVICCCGPAPPEKEDVDAAEDAEAAAARGSLGWIVGISERFSERLPRNSRAQRISKRVSRRLSHRIERAENMVQRFSQPRASARASIAGPRGSAPSRGAAPSAAEDTIPEESGRASNQDAMGPSPSARERLSRQLTGTLSSTARALTMSNAKVAPNRKNLTWGSPARRIAMA